MEQMTLNFAELRGRIAEKYGTRRAFAAAMNMKENVLSGRLQYKTNFTPEEIYQACQLLDIALVDIPRFFYAFEFAFRNK